MTEAITRATVVERSYQEPTAAHTTRRCRRILSPAALTLLVTLFSQTAVVSADDTPSPSNRGVKADPADQDIESALRLVQKKTGIDVRVRVPKSRTTKKSIAIRITSSGDSEDVLLVATSRRSTNGPTRLASSTEHLGTIPTSNRAAKPNDGILQVTPNDRVSATYEHETQNRTARIQLGRLKTPPMTRGAPAAGKRVRQVTPEYAGTAVHHTLYLPRDWRRTRAQAGGAYPVIVEYTGNRWPASGSTGKVEDANLGYGLTGGEGFIWVVLPSVAKDRKQNAVTWWGDLDATLDYCKLNVPRICKEFGGDPKKVFLCGFSRGAIAANFLGLADDEIAKLWRGFITHDHYDGVFKVSDEASALERLKRLGGRPQLICSALGTEKTRAYLAKQTSLENFTFLDVPVTELFEIPDGKIIHPHTDLWMHVDSIYRQEARRWLEAIARRPNSSLKK